MRKEVKQQKMNNLARLHKGKLEPNSKWRK